MEPFGADVWDEGTEQLRPQSLEGVGGDCLLLQLDVHLGAGSLGRGAPGAANPMGPRLVQLADLSSTVSSPGHELSITLLCGVLAVSLSALCALLAWVFSDEASGAGSEEDGQAKGGKGKSRLAVLDNAKFLLMILIVVDHLKGNAGGEWGWKWGVGTLEGITQMHTRSYCFLNGLVAKDGPSTRALRNVVTRLLVPLLLFAIVEPLLEGRVKDYRNQLKYRVEFARWPWCGEPAALLPIWYLHALLWWRLGGFLLHPLPPVAKLLVAFLISSAGGYLKLIQCSALEPAASFFVVYVAGQLCPVEELLRRVPSTWGSFATGMLYLLVSSFFLASPLGLAFMDDSVVPIWGWAGVAHHGGLAHGLYFLRGLFRHVFELSRFFAFLVLGVCPRGSSVLSNLGQRSLYAYLLNGPLVHDLFKMVHVPVSPYYLGKLIQWEALVVLSVFITLLLSAAPVREVFRHILEPVWLEQLLDAAGAGPAAGKLPLPASPTQEPPEVRSTPAASAGSPAASGPVSAAAPSGA